MNDDLDDGLIDSEDGFDEFSQKASLGDIIRKSPIAKVGIVIAVVVIGGSAMVMFGGDQVKEQQSSIPQGSDVTSVPGANEEVSPAYTAAVEQQNEADLERAIMGGGSSIPVPVGTHDTRLTVPEVEEEAEDPLHRWRMLQEERVEREMRAKEADVEPVTVLNAEKQSEAVEELAESMVQQMESVLGKSTEDKAFTTKTLISYGDGDGDGGVGDGGTYDSGGGGSSDDTSLFQEESEEIIIIPAGKIVYGQMLLEANSDIPSVILAQMVSGPLKGWKLLGKFNLEEDIKMLTVDFNVAVNEEGKQYKIKAIMLDPDTSLSAKASDVNNRYIRRIVLPAAAKFVTGFADAIAEAGRTSISVAGGSGGAAVTEEEAEPTKDQEVATGVADMAQDIGEFLEEYGDVPMQVMLKAGTPIGIFFTKNVVETSGGI